MSATKPHRKEALKAALGDIAFAQYAEGNAGQPIPRFFSICKVGSLGEDPRDAVWPPASEQEMSEDYRVEGHATHEEMSEYLHEAIHNDSLPIRMIDLDDMVILLPA